MVFSKEMVAILEKMSKIVRHKWITQNGFRNEKCQYCNCIRKWDDGWQRQVYMVDGRYLRLFTPSCKRVYFNDLIEKT